MPKEIEEGTREDDEAPAPADDSHISPEGVVESPASAPADGDRDRDDDLVEVVIAGQTIKIDSTAALLLDTERTQLAQQQQAPVEAPVADDRASDEEGYAELLFSDPNAAIKKLKAEMRQEIAADYNADQSRRDFWDDFYRENTDLRDEDHLVQATLSKHISALENMRGKAGRDKLAELTKKDILNLTKKYNKSAVKNDTVTLEGADGGQEVFSEPTADKEPTRLPSLGDVIKQRRLSRAKASRGNASVAD